MDSVASAAELPIRLLVAGLVADALLAYAAIGLAAGLYLAFRGVGLLDPAARGGGWGFRLIILPGCVALWPLLLFRLARGRRQPPEERNAHRDAAEAAP